MQKLELKTILFDMDGVVIDSEKLHLRAMGLTLEQHGIEYSQSFLNGYVGRSDESFFRYVYENMDNTHSMEELLEEKNAFFEDLLKELKYVEGFTDFIQKVKPIKLQAGLVTSSSLFTVQKVDKLLNLTSFFDIVITEEDTQKHKPNPEPYLLALENLGANHRSTLIIEDSINGILAGKAAGCRVAGLTTSFDAATLKDAGADWVISNFSDFPPFTYYKDP
ncbi:HAD family hydrolase [Proteiniphilum acetatigenes]|uniref:HAD family hydrolase n=1 Tax=Proteiniphilum acetatigenes TaxID=294710 RepID=UPI000363678C|nr:HAD family phosphatase [Proteiniphilum acetatigenes]SFK35005.1 haloacid dehalogenase superfamily, subfamily IA, variant 3 with third motif having DD or ED/haloacid dehalogenase superfamily, subfamily IA, variant 1 with third motif having Dx(3-4)D or Dx(3-4)E [Porphyromonadaceae bacterium KH3CP3RA]